MRRLYGHDQNRRKAPAKTSTLTPTDASGADVWARQPEHVSESGPPLHRYLGNSYVEAMTDSKAATATPNSR